MIDFTKFQYLVNDINWMNEMKGKVTEKEAEKKARNDERKAKKEKYEREKEERK